MAFGHCEKPDERYTPETMAAWNMSACIMGVNWKTGEHKINFIAGDDVEARAKCSAEVYNRSWPDWTFTYVLKGPNV